MNNTNFSDQSAVEYIRQALWRESTEGRASVMVGAGFSRNADPTSLSARPMPTWAQMSNALCSSLYASSSEERRKNALNEANSTSGFLRLAQEYEAAFGRTSLNEQIRNLVPDLDYEPGDLHAQLVNLPWRDIFTTNWDTLLERSARDVFHRSYDIVRTATEIPLASRNRIVKLHGSFPANEPFVFTEDDYRHYPKIHAPFVNMVQQSLMESVLCLIGFSGDDPNFLHWSGWVRDNLGKNAPKIFLVGWLELSPSRRRMLEDRNVVPIDLANLPKADSWPQNLRHRYATEWFLASISVRSQFAVQNWPMNVRTETVTPAHLGVVMRPIEELPIDEPFSANIGISSIEENVDQVRSTIKIWKWNRNLYPGWLIAPLSVRERVYSKTEHWILKIISIQTAVSPDEYLLILDEMMWRLDVSLCPYYADLIEMYLAALKRVDLEKQMLEGKDGNFQLSANADWNLLMKAWGRIALVVARSSREDGLFDRASDFLRAVDQLALHDQELQETILYEKCLMLRDKGDFFDLDSALDNWVIKSTDATWMLKKAGLYVNIGKHSAASTLGMQALLKIRRFCRKDCVDYRSHSQEAWALWFQLAVRVKLDTNSISNVGESSPQQRWLELGVHYCNAYDDYFKLLADIERKSAKNTKFFEIKKSFDFGVVSHSFTSDSNLNDLYRYGTSLLRLSNETGVPASLHNVGLISEGLNRAISLLRNQEIWMCSIWAVRLASSQSDEVLAFFSRTQIASLTNENLEGLRKHIVGQISFFIAVIKSASIEKKYAVSRLTVLIEVYSRVVLRLDVEQLKEAFSTGIQFFSDKSLFSIRPLRDSLAKLLSRSIESIPPPNLPNFLIELLSLRMTWQISDGDDALPEVTRWLPGNVYFQVVDITKRDVRWNLILDQLEADLASEKLELVSNAQYRLCELNRVGLLALSDKQKFASVLWLDSNGLFREPQLVNLNTFSIFYFPELEEGQAASYFRKRELNSADTLTLLDVRKKFNEVVGAIRNTHGSSLEFSLTENDKTVLVGALQYWVNQAIELKSNDMRDFFSGLGNEASEIDTLLILPMLLRHLQLDLELASQIWEKTERMESSYSLGTLGIFASLLLFLPSKADEIERKCREALVSQNLKTCRGACFGIHRWIFENMKNPETMPKPPVDLIIELGSAVSARRHSILVPGIEFFIWLYSDGPAEFHSQAFDNICKGLIYLKEEAAYGGALNDNAEIDLPALRYKLVELAIALSESGYNNIDVINEWIEEGKKDPLPEVRYAAFTHGRYKEPIRICE